MMRPPGTIGGSTSSDSAEMADLQTLLDRIALEGTREDPASIEEVAENLRLRLNLRVGDDSIFQSLAAQLLHVRISGLEASPQGDQGSSSPMKGEPELQNTWSTETSSTANSFSESSGVHPTQASTPQGSNSRVDKGTFDSTGGQNNFHAASEQVRGRSPMRDNGSQRDAPSAPSFTPELSRGGNRPPTSDYKQKPSNNDRSNNNSCSRRSPSPFRFTNPFRKSKDPQTDTSPANGVPLQSRSFERSGSVNPSASGSVNPSASSPKPPLSPYPSPYPPSCDTSFGSSLPPTPNISINGLAYDAPGIASATKSGNFSDFSSFLDSPNLQPSTTPLQAPGGSMAENGVERPPLSRPTEPRSSFKSPRQEPVQTQPQTNDERARGRGRSRTPSRMNPRIHTPSQSRSKSLPRTMSKSPFRGFFSATRPSFKADSVQTSDTTGNTTPRTGAACPVVPNDQQQKDQKQHQQQQQPSQQYQEQQLRPSQLHQSDTAVPKSSPLKTPLSHITGTESEVVTGKGKMRRKMADPVEMPLSPGPLTTDDSFASMDGTDGAAAASETAASNGSMFNVDLTGGTKQSKRKQRPGGRRNKANNANVRTPAPISIPDPTIPTEPVLTPMDTDSKPSFEETLATNTSFEAPFSMADNGAQGVTQGVAQAVQFSMGSKAGKRTSKRGSRVRTNRNTQKQNADTSTRNSAGTSSYSQSQSQPELSQNQAGIDHAMILDQINLIRDKAKKFYLDGNYGTSILWYTEAIKLFSTLSQEVAPSELLGLLLTNRAAALLMIRATEAAVDDCKLAIRHVSPLVLPQSALTTEKGPALLAKSYIRMARAHLKAGKVEQADLAFNNAISTAEDGLTQCRQLHSKIEFDRDDRVLSQMITDATLGKADVSQFQATISRINSYKLPSLQPGRAQLADRKTAVTALSEVNSAITTAPACVELHEKKIALLSGLKRWREVAGHCERLAASHVQFDDVFKGDLETRNPFPDTPPAKVLPANFFGDSREEDYYKAKDLESAELKLNSKQTAEAVLRMPHSLISTYLRSLRLEERYPAADAGIKALEALVKSKVNTAGYNRLFTNFAWLSREASKLNRTKKGRERGDELFRAGDFDLAAAQYASCLKIDAEGSDERNDSSGASGGRLHAVLHCNRAACLMAVRKFEEAVQECTAAIRIHNRYMKAILRRGRCYSRLNRCEEAVNEYSKWLGLVDDAKGQGGSAAFLSTCLFDGPQKVTREEYNQVKVELDEALKLKQRKEKAAREEASYRQERQKFHEAFSDAQRRREHWYSQQGTSSRRWDSFTGDNSGGTKRSPKQKAQQQQQHSHRQSESKRGSQRKTDNNLPAQGTHYAVLEIPQNATELDIKKAYRKMALKYHPDKNSDPQAPDFFRKVKNAYEVLNDASSRRQYDQELRWGGGAYPRRF